VVHSRGRGAGFLRAAAAVVRPDCRVTSDIVNRPNARINEPIQQMTLGNMRANGVRSLDVTSRPRCAAGMFSAIPIGPFQSALAAFAASMAIPRQCPENPL
jgi:hypothetical protein